MAEAQRGIEPVFQRAATGEMAPISRIKEALAAPVPQTGHQTTIYRLLARQGWRKLAPRAKPPEATAALPAAVKKTLRRLAKPPFRPAHPMLRARSS
jgi:hypothetical protein